LKDAPLYYEKINNLINKYYIFLKSNFNISLDGQNINVLSPERLLSSLISVISYVKDSIVKVIYSLPDIFMYIAFSIISAFFISRDKDKILILLKKVLPNSIIIIASKVNKSIASLVKTEFVLVAISTIQTILGFLMLNISYAVLIGVIIGILDILPVVGPGIIIIPWVIYSFLSGNTTFAISLICLYIIIVVTRQVLETKLISGNLDVHPLMVLVSIYVGLKFFGI
jgi:sporulation integral membrane protein YtvI